VVLQKRNVRFRPRLVAVELLIRGLAERRSLDILDLTLLGVGDLTLVVGVDGEVDGGKSGSTVVDGGESGFCVLLTSCTRIG
jgi:hypothetical protein